MASQLTQRLNIEDIDSDICVIDYAGFKVLAYKVEPYKNYVNATKLCDEHRKAYSEWFESEMVQNILDPLVVSAFEILSDIVYCRGTYIHPDLLPSLLQWLSIEFYHKVAQLTNEHYACEQNIVNNDSTVRRKAIVNHKSPHEVDRLQDPSAVCWHKDTRFLFKDQTIKLDKHSNALATLQETTNSLVAQVSALHIKQDELRGIVTRGRSINIHVEKTSSIPVSQVCKEIRKFDSLTKPHNILSTLFLSVVVVKVHEPVVSTHYIVTRSQWSQHKKKVNNTIAQALSKYKKPVYSKYYALIEASAAAIQIWNELKERKLVRINTNELSVDETQFHQLMKELEDISIAPDNEIDILVAEYTRLQGSTLAEDKAFLKELS